VTSRGPRAALLVLAWLPACGVAGQAASERRGPIEAREEWLPAQARLNLPATSPDLLASGRVEVRLHADWGNDFGWRQDRGGETPADRRYLVDGEHRSLALELRRGLRPRFELGLRIPLFWRGPGLLDGVIDWFHGFTRKLGLPDNQRGRFLRDQFRILGRDVRGRPLTFDGVAGAGLGRLELSARLALTSVAERSWAWALVPRLALPTGSGAFDVPGIEAGAQLVGARALGARWDLYLGAGATFGGPRRLDGLAVPRSRPHGFAALEWRPARRLSLSAQIDGASRALDGVAQYPALQSYLRFGAQLDLGPRWRLSGGFSENIVHQQATTDFGVFAGLARRF
jgi:hypothetical protein